MDNRREKTEQRIREAYIKLLMHHDPEDISVKCLCQQCHINRCTFYDHYSFLENLVDDILKREVHNICAVIDRKGLESIDYSSGIPKNQIKSYIKELYNSRIIFAFLSSKQSDYYKQKIISFQTDLTLEKLKKNEISYFRAYFQNVGATSTILQWIEKGEVLPLDELIEIINGFSVAMYQ